MLKRGWASEKLSSQPTSWIQLHTFIILHKLVPQKTFNSLIVHLRLIPVYGSSWMYKIKQKLICGPFFSQTQLHFGLNLLPLFGLFSAQIMKMRLNPTPCSYLFLQIMISLHHAMSSVRYIMADNPGK